MSHEITERADGTAEAFYAGDGKVLRPAWHGLGTNILDAVNSERALELAQLDWIVNQEPLYQMLPETIDSSWGATPQSYREVPNIKLNTRSDNGFHLGTVTDQYAPVQNRKAFEFMDSLVMDGIIKYEAAMSLKGGKQVVILARAPKEEVIVGEDKTRRFYVFSTSHDGTSGIQFGATSIRVVCQNTFRMAESDLKSISHTGDVREKMLAALENIKGINKAFDTYEDNCRRLADYKMAGKDWSDFLDVLAPIPVKIDPDYTAARENAVRKTRAAMSLTYRNERQTMEGVDRTAWAALNAVTEHVDHMPRRGANERARSETRFNVTQYGAGHNIKDRAYKTACKMADVCLN